MNLASLQFLRMRFMRRLLDRLYLSSYCFRHALLREYDIEERIAEVLEFNVIGFRFFQASMFLCSGIQSTPDLSDLSAPLLLR